jgi:integrase
VSAGHAETLKYQLEHFRRYAGERQIAEANANLLAGYHATLLTEIKKGKAARYAKGLLSAAKSFFQWLFDSEIIDKLPRNMRKLQIVADLQPVKTLTVKEIQTVLTEANERTKLFVLLMLNCGFYPQDISDLKPSEVNWKEGRITRKRSKTKREHNVPIVEYPLWRETFDLLRKIGNKKGERVLSNNAGKPLCRWEANGRRNAVQKSWENLQEHTGVKKPLKLLRKTSASTLAKHHTYGQFARLFLGHAPATVAERHYVAVPQQLFDEAVKWLATQYGVK